MIEFILIDESTSFFGCSLVTISSEGVTSFSKSSPSTSKIAISELTLIFSVPSETTS